MYIYIYILTEYGDLCSALENANFFIETLFSLPPPRSNPFVHYPCSPLHAIYYVYTIFYRIDCYCGFVKRQSGIEIKVYIILLYIVFETFR